MSKKRAALKYTTLALVTAGYGGAIWKTHQGIDQAREPISRDEFKMIAATAVTLTGLTWLVAKL